jgi:hypothetical protein
MRVRALAFLLLVASTSACGAKATDPPPPPPCDDKCRDGIAIRSVREMAKLAFNILLQGKPIGTHDESSPCPMGGTVRVFGSASSNATQGSTEVELTYVFDRCGYLAQDDEPEDNYNMVVSGTLVQNGTLAVQPTSTTALVMKSDSIAFSGTVYEPPIDFNETCPLTLGQNGNSLTGTICARPASNDL